MKERRYIETFWIPCCFLALLTYEKAYRLRIPTFLYAYLSRNRTYFEDISYGLYLYTLFRFVIKKDSKKHYPADLLIIEAIYQYGNGSKNINHKGFPLNEEGFLNESIIDETQIKVDSSYF